MKLNKEFIANFREEAKKARWEINSWNGKGIDDLVVDYLERKELKPEDFTGAVVLTVEEAYKLKQKTHWVLMTLGFENQSLNKKYLQEIYDFFSRSEQAEVQDEIK